MSARPREGRGGGLAVVGGGIAAQALIERVRERDPGMPITLYCEEATPPYDRVRLTELLAADASLSELRLRPDEWYHDHRVELRAGVTVEALEPKAFKLLAGGAAHVYDRICLATGSTPLIPPIDGAAREGVYRYRDPSDCAAIARRCAPGARAAVIGGGLLGLEAAKALAARGCDVTVVHLMDRLMERQLDGESAGILRERMRELGVEVLTERTTAKVLGDSAVQGLEFADGERLACDLVVISAGIAPRAELARAAGIECDRGILVDDTMQTSAPGVYAVGECAEHAGAVYGLVAPIIEQCEVAAAAIAQAEQARYAGSVASAKLKVMGVELATIGDANSGDAAIASRPRDGVYRKLVFNDGRLTGAVLMGDTRGYELLLEIATSRSPVDDPLAMLARASEATADELPDGAQICNCNGVCKGEIVAAIRERGLASTQEVIAVTRAGAGCGSCKPIVSELVKLATGGSGDEPAYLCPCRKLTNSDIAEAIRANGVDSVSGVSERCGAGRDCGACKPGIAYLVSEINDNRHREERHARFINDRVHANIQKDGTFSVVPRIRGGVTTPDELRRIADVAEKYGVPMVKITGGQRIDLLGVDKEQLPAIWEDLGMPSGHAYAKAVRTVKTCVGSQFCRFGLDDSIATGIEFERAWEGVHTPHKVKSAVSGCPRNCAEASTKDLGLIAVEGGWQVRVGGAAGASVREGDVLTTVATKAEAMRVASAFLQYYREHAEYLERTYGFVVRIGLEAVRAAVLDESSGEPARLRRRLRLAKAAATDPWLERRDPVHHKQFAEIDSEPMLTVAKSPLTAADGGEIR